MDQDALGTQIGLGPGDIVLDGDPSAPHGKGDSSPTTFAVYRRSRGPCLLWPSGWMDQDTTLHGTEVGLVPGDIVIDGDPAPPPRKGALQNPLFGPCLL